MLDGRLDKAEVLCSDSHGSYTAFAKGIKAEHKKFKASKGLRKTKKDLPRAECQQHGQAVEGLHAALQQGGYHVPAELPELVLVLEKVKHSTRRMAATTAIALASNTAWFEYKRELFYMLMRT